MLEVENLTVSYGAHRALEKVSVRVGPGEICVILGANGAGKSSLLKAIGGIIRVSAGSRIAIDSRDITGSKPHKVVEAGLALVPEGRGIFGDLTVAENLQLGAYGSQARKGEEKRLAQVLELFPRLGERKRQIARTMSGGEQQMVAIGRALMSNPRILMLDEPSLGLSPILTKDLFRSLAAVRETGVGILLVEQNAKQSLAIADRGYLIENGHITGYGTGEDLARDPAVQSAYLGGAVAKRSIPEMSDTVSRPAMPVAANLPAGSAAEAFAERAARIQREHVLARRTGIATNGQAHPMADELNQTGEAMKMSNQAHELSIQAGEFAKNAARIQKQHVDAQRIGSHLSAASRWAHDNSKDTEAPVHAPDRGTLDSGDPRRQTAAYVARAARIQKDYVAEKRSADAMKLRNGEDRSEVAGAANLKDSNKAKKAKKASKKARKLVERALRIGH